MVKEVKSLKLAPWWKRFLAYSIDQIFLFVFLIIFIMGIYGDQFTELMNNINNMNATSLLKDSLSDVFSVDEINRLSPERQTQFYLIQLIQTKYSRSIFLLSQILSSLYFLLFWSGTGQTFGAKLLKIKVISYIGSKPHFLAVGIRVIMLKIMEIAWGLPALIVTNPLFKQRLHDSVSQTIVVEDFDMEEFVEKREVKEEEQPEYHPNKKD
ncbi:MAG: RDD family protein [Brevinema sp.]